MSTSLLYHAFRVRDYRYVRTEQAVAANRFGEALQLMSIAQASARKAKDTALIKKLSDRAKQLTAQDYAYHSAQSALKTLAKDLQDPEANLIAGKYVCFDLNDWNRGLAMLALGSDAPFKSVAQQELANPQTTEAFEQLGDAWWDLAAKPDAPKACLDRAVDWYRQAQPNLQGLKKVKVEKRLEEASK